MRYLIAAGTRHYREDPELPLVPGDVEDVVELFRSMGYERVLASVSEDPDSADFEDALSDWCGAPGLAADDVVVVYYAGHGNRAPSGHYRLACADTTYQRPRSWLSLPSLAEVLATSPVRNVLFVVDACHAAAAGAEIGAVTDTIVAGRGRGEALGSGTWLLASARHRDAAVDGAFVAELEKACGQGEGPSQRYLAPGTIADRVNRSFTASGLRQRAACSSVDQSEPPPFFPNPLFDPGAEVTAVGRVCGDASDLSSHFEPRGRGVEQVYDPGSYFTGRERALREARAHLAGEGDAGVLVVTADPGSGKSAVLGRLVLDGCTDASVNAHHQTLDALVARLAAAADVRAAGPAALFAALADRRTPFRVVVDSLDEAGPGGDKAEARRIAWELLRPLAGIACVRLVVGSRRELLPHTGDRVPVIDLDDSTYADDTDTAEYVARIICDTGAPYRDQPDIGRQVAEEVARRAGRCFLVARMTASALLRGRPVDTTVPGWAEQLPSDVGGAFETYLQRLPAERYGSTMALLTALAFGEGNGLPRKIWVRVAARLSGLPLTEAHVDVLLDEDGSYLAHASVDGTRYFRLYHQELTDHMKGRVLKHRDLGDVQECFVETLLGLVPDRDWPRAHPYVRAHLATHAAGSGALDDLIEDASFVVSAERSTLVPAVRHAQRTPLLSMAVERYGYLLADRDPETADPAGLLAFVAGTYGQHGLARQAEGLSTSLEHVRVEPRGITPHRVVGRHEGGAYAIRSVNPNWKIEDLVLRKGGRVVLAAPPHSPHVHVWLLDDPSQSTILPHPEDVVGLAVLTDRVGRSEVVTLDAVGTLRMWDVEHQTLSRTLSDTGYDQLFDAGFLTDGTAVVVCGNADSVVAFSILASEPLVEVDCPTPRNRSWNDEFRASACLGQDTEGHVGLLTCDGLRGRVVLHPLEGDRRTTVLLEGLKSPVLVDHIRGPSGTLAAVAVARVEMHLVDLGSRKIKTMPFGGFSWQESGFAYGSGEDPVFVAQDHERLLTTRLNSPPGWIAVKDKDVSHAMLMAPVLHDGRLYALVDGFGVHLSVVDCATGDSIGLPLLGHEGAVCGLRLIAAGGAVGPDILAIGNDGTARLWSWGVHEARTAGARPVSTEGRFSAPEIEGLLSWTRDPAAVVGVSGRRFRRVESALRTDPANGDHRSYARSVALGNCPREEDCVEDPDGTLHTLSWKYTGHVKLERTSGLSGWPDSSPVSHCVWHRVRPGDVVENVSFDWLHGHREGVRGQLLPSTRMQPRTRFVGFDVVRARVRLLDGPEEKPDWVDLPWTPDPGNDYVCSTAFTMTSGDAVLMTGSRTMREWESSVGGRSARRPDSGGVAGTHARQAESPTAGRMWNIATGAPYQSEIELAHDVHLLLPDHGAAGTRWVAQHGRDGATSVVDLKTNRRHAVNPPRGTTTESGGGHRTPGFRTLTSGHSYFLRWADMSTGGPVLLYLDQTLSNDADPAPVAVWDPATPDEPRSLPVPASRLLWTGSAPSGEALVAVSDGRGVTLCHLPSCEKVWSAPVPALVTSLRALPGNPFLDLAVGTQQGVVFLRPRLSAGWRERLGVLRSRPGGPSVP
ncbi:caspase family protein [Streptomyces sp. ISL-43]|uniref:caspase family protein n=1 Tax=Streptomyces sp. ISL-43 TaxID=2819183 RepID=UPI001BE79C04|nr:caspase family protein [Streptomyces sp. ISL-43]MBT2451969.1 caspase family protein [Streptomyces sp. ISL-43]